MSDILHFSKHPLRDDHDVVPVFQSRTELFKQIEFDRLECKHVYLLVSQRRNKLFYLLVSCRSWSPIFDRLEQKLKEIICKLFLILGCIFVVKIYTNDN